VALMAKLALILFGDVDGDVWGAGLAAGTSTLIVGDGSGERAMFDVMLAECSEVSEDWRLTAQGVDLRVASSGEDDPGRFRDAGSPIADSQRLCRVHGTVTLGQTERAVDCAGTRAVIDGVDAGALHSVRAVSGWTQGGDAFGLIALRAPGGRGQESDLVSATLFDPDGWIAVDDPRLSTTYDGEGHPRRVNLELWIGDEEHEFPRRAAGEIAGPGISGEIDGSGAVGELGRARLEAVPLRSHSRGHEGGGVYAMLTVVG
jgi:hypothetical protein